MRWLSVTPLASGHACNELATPLALRHVCRSRSRADVRPFMARTDAPAALDRRLTIHGHTERLRRRAVLHPGVPRTLVSEIDRRSSQSPDERSGAGQVAPLASATRAGKVAVCATSQSHPWPSAMCATEKSPCAQRVSHAPGFGHACTPDRTSRASGFGHARRKSRRVRNESVTPLVFDHVCNGKVAVCATSQSRPWLRPRVHSGSRVGDSWLGWLAASFSRRNRRMRTHGHRRKLQPSTSPSLDPIVSRWRQQVSHPHRPPARCGVRLFIARTRARWVVDTGPQATCATRMQSVSAAAVDRCTSHTPSRVSVYS